MIMVLEDRGVKLQTFMRLQNKAVAEARTIHQALSQFRQVLEAHSLGTSYRLAFVIEQLIGLGLDINSLDPKQRIDSAFLSRVRHFAMSHVLRDIKHRARILIPDSWLLVGVADEGPAYAGREGYEHVYVLPAGHIFGWLFSALVGYIQSSSLSVKRVYRHQETKTQRGSKVLAPYQEVLSCILEIVGFNWNVSGIKQ